MGKAKAKSKKISAIDEKSKEGGNFFLTKARISGPTKELNPRVEVVAFRTDIDKKTHVITTNLRKHGDKFAEMAREVKQALDDAETLGKPFTLPRAKWLASQVCRFTE